MSQVFPEVKQVRDVGLENKTDTEIWQFAKSNGFAIVTFDADYYDLMTVKGFPPKIIWLRLGNTSTSRIVASLVMRREVIHAFLNDEQYAEIGCLEIRN